MKHFYQISLLLLMLVSTITIQAQEFTLTGEVRPRTEFRNGFKTPTTSANDPALFTEQRSRIYFDYKESKYKIRVSFQDVRIWGEIPQIFKQEDGNTYLSEAWGQYFVNDKFSIKAGRQIISYDNQRFLGGLEWAQQGRRHDALLGIYEDKESKTKLHVGVAYNSDDDVAEPGYIQSDGASFYSVGGNYKAMEYAWFKQGFTGGSISVLALNATYQSADTTNYSKQTLGAHGKFKAMDNLSFGGDVYYQMGKSGDSDVSALLAGVNATFKTKLTPITVGIEYISGKDDDDTSSDVTNFSPDFGTNHAHNGFMDYFFVGPANGNVGVTDVYLKTKFKLPKGIIKAHAHQFFTGSTQLDANGDELSSAMGLEIDLVYAVKLAKGVSFNVGYSQMFGTSTLTAIRPGDEKMNNWAWTMITFKPELLKFKKDEEGLWR